jgi:hypothetical protein
MASDISEVDADRHLDSGPFAWNFRNEVLRRVFHRIAVHRDPV